MEPKAPKSLKSDFVLFLKISQTDKMLKKEVQPAIAGKGLTEGYF